MGERSGDREWPGGRSLVAARALLVTLVVAVGLARPAWAQSRPSAPAQKPATDPAGAARSAYDGALRQHGPNHVNTVVKGFDFATSLAQLGRYAEAKPIYRSLETSLPRVFAPDGPEMARLLADMATVWERSGEFVGALSYAERADALYRHRPGSPDPQAVAVVLQLARLTSEFGRVAESTAILERAEGQLAGLPQPPSNLVWAARQIAFGLALAQGRTADARALVPALETAATAAGVADPAAEAEIAAVRVLLREGRLLEANDRLTALAARLGQGAAAETLPQAAVLYYQG